MQRRNFLLGAFGLGGLCPFALRAQTPNHAGMGNMPGMSDMSGHAAMPGMAMAPAPAQSSAALAPADAIPGGAALRELPRLQNESREPGVFRATLTAAPVRVSLLPGQQTELWAYNGVSPGPLIELHAGDQVEITLRNGLSQPTTLHWHGLPVPADQDGNPAEQVEPGGSRTYRFTLPADTQGLYWYHPHPHRLSGEQVYRGLAGAILVTPAQDPLAALPQRVLMVTDLKLDRDGAIAANDAGDWMNGREGQFALVNGQRRPHLAFSAGGRERWRILNASNARYLRLQLPQHGMTLVGTDGGLLAQPRGGLREYLLAPAQRIDIVVDAPGARAGSLATLLAASYERGKMGGAPTAAAMPLLDVAFGAAQPGTVPLAALPATLRVLPELGAATARKRVIMSEAMKMGDAGRSGNGSMSVEAAAQQMAFLLNGHTFDMRRMDLTSKAGETELWEIVNQSDMDHPFHIHGTQFQVIEREMHGQISREPYAALHDTVNLKAGETVRFKIVQATPGMRMYHCHLLEHEDLGMMGQLQVV